MGRATEHSPEHYPWTRPDMLPHAVASAGWGARYPGLRYDRKQSPDRIIPHDVIRETFLQERFAVVVWQGPHLSFIDISHIPERTFVAENRDRSLTDWANIKRYRLNRDTPIFTTLEENLDPREIMPSVHAVLATPLGFAPGAQTVVDARVPIDRLFIEFPAHTEDRELPLSTTIGVLGGIATQEYIDTIYGPPKV